MATETFWAKHTNAKTVFFRFFDLATPGSPLGFDFNDSTWKAAGTETTPKLAATEVTAAGDANESLYAASQNLATLYNTAAPKEFIVQAVDDLATDEVIGESSIFLSSGELMPESRVNVDLIESADATTTIANTVWDELKSAHTTADTFGDYLDDEITSRSPLPTGPNTLTVTVKDSGAVALTGKGLTLKNADGSVAGARQLTNGSGQVVWNVEDATYTVAIDADPGYTWDNATISVPVSGAAATGTFTGTAVTEPSALSMTLGTLIGYVRNLAGERDSTTLTNALLTHFANDGISEMARRFNLTELEYTETVSLADGTKTLNLASGLTYVPREIMRIVIVDATNTAVYSLDEVDRDTMVEDYTRLVTTTSQEARPTEYCIFGTTLYWLPTPDATYTARLDYRYLPGLLTYSDGSEVNAITQYAPQVLLAYMVAEAYDYLQQPEKAEVWRRRFEERLAAFVISEGKKATENMFPELDLDDGGYDYNDY